MRSQNRRVEHQFLQVLGADFVKDPLPDISFSPAVEALEGGIPGAKTLRQIAPRGTGAKHPNDRVTKRRLSFAV